MRSPNGETIAHNCQEASKQKYIYNNSTFKTFAFASAQVTTQYNLIFTHFVPVVDIDPDSNMPPYSYLPSSKKNCAGARLSSSLRGKQPYWRTWVMWTGGSIVLRGIQLRLTVVFFCPRTADRVCLGRNACFFRTSNLGFTWLGVNFHILLLSWLAHGCGLSLMFSCSDCVRVLSVCTNPELSPWVYMSSLNL